MEDAIYIHVTYTLWFHQTWLAGKSHVNEGFIGKMVQNIQHAMFDETGGYFFCTTGNWNGENPYTIWLFNIASCKIHYKWLIFPGKIIYFYGSWLPWLCSITTR